MSRMLDLIASLGTWTLKANFSECPLKIESLVIFDGVLHRKSFDKNGKKTLLTKFLTKKFRIGDNWDAAWKMLLEFEKWYCCPNLARKLQEFINTWQTCNKSNLTTRHKLSPPSRRFLRSVHEGSGHDELLETYRWAFPCLFYLKTFMSNSHHGMRKYNYSSVKSAAGCIDSFGDDKQSVSAPRKFSVAQLSAVIVSNCPCRGPEGRGNWSNGLVTWCEFWA